VTPTKTEIFGWFHACNRSSLEKLIRKYSIRSVIEIGSFLGLSAAWFAERVERVTCIDPFEWWGEPGIGLNGNTNTGNLIRDFTEHDVPTKFFNVFKANMIERGVWSKITPVIGHSEDVYHHVLPADLVYIDGEHTYEGVARDIRNYLPKAIKVICGDDYVSRDGFGVIRAVCELFPRHDVNGPFWSFER